jgi:hypothetical protein
MYKDEGFTWGYYLAPLVTAFQPLSGLDNYVINLLYFTQSGNAIYRKICQFSSLRKISKELAKILAYIQSLSLF